MANTTVAIYSKLFLDEQDDSWSARPSRRLLEWLHGQDETSARWLVVIGGVRICLGDPVRSTETRTKDLYVPQWILDAAGVSAEGDEIRLRFERSESLSRATKLEFKVMGEIPDDLDMKELLEEPLSQLGVLEEGMILPAPVLEGVHLLVQTCEPAGQPVFLDGEAELVMEDDDAVIARRQEEINQRQQQKEEAKKEEEKADDSMFSFLPSPPAAAVPASGRSRGYIPFQGVGRRLCDSS